MSVVRGLSLLLIVCAACGSDEPAPSPSELPTPTWPQAPSSENGFLEPGLVVGLARAEMTCDTLVLPPYPDQIREGGRRGHYRSVTALCWAGDRLLSAAHDNAVLAWKDGQVVHARFRLPASVIAMSYHPERGQVLCALSNKTVQLWDAKTLKTVRTYRGHGRWVTGVDWSRDGTWFASCSWDGTTRIWDSKTGETREVIRGHDKFCWDVAVSPDSKLVATASAALVVWNVPERRVQYRHEVERGTGGGDLAFTDDGKWLLTNGHLAFGDATALDARTGEVLFHFPERAGATLVTTGPWIFMCHAEGTIELWHQAEEEVVDSVRIESDLGTVNHPATTDGRRIWFGADDARIYSYTLARKSHAQDRR